MPVGLILWRTFSPGVGAFFESITTPAAVSALQLSLLVVAIVVPLNVLFGVPTALVLARNRFRGKSLLQAVIDLPFAVSPVVVGVALILLWGTDGLFGFVQNDLGFKIIFGFPGIVLASIFVTVPFVIREVEPVLHELGTDQEEAAATLGSSWWQTFWRITLPSIRWGLMYGDRADGRAHARRVRRGDDRGGEPARLVADAHPAGGGQVQPRRRIRRLRRFHAADDGRGACTGRSGDSRLASRENGQLGLEETLT